MTKLSIAVAAITTSALVALGSPVQASDGGDDGRVVKTGTCSDGARWKLKVKTDDGRLEVEGEVDSNRSGQTWHWKIRDNGSVAARGTATTGGRSGSFEVEREIADQAGTDTVTFKAKHAGQVCKGAITF
jgi:hypothetical protein